MDTVDSIGAYRSFYSIWNSLNVLPMTQSDAHNEGRENKTAVDFLIEFSPTPKAGYEDTWILRSMEAYKRQETESLRDQLSKEREITEQIKKSFGQIAHDLKMDLQKEREINAKLKLSHNITVTDYEVKLEEEREMRKELVHGITKSDSELLEIGKGFAEYPYKESVIENVDDFTSGFYAGWKTLSGNIEVILAKASELDKNQKQ